MAGFLGLEKPKKEKVNLNPKQQEWFQKNGYQYERAEIWNAYAGCYNDLWGFADYLACRPGEILLVQTTTKPNVNARYKKSTEEKGTALANWLRAGGRYQIHGWIPAEGRGTRWQLEITEVILEGEGFAKKRAEPSR